MRFITLLLLFFACTSVRAQTMTGRITDAESGEPLPFASIYVPATKSGSASNGDGYFQVELGGGRKVVFSYLGYQTQVKTVSGGTVDVQLVSEALELEQIEIISGGEDRSYAVIRRAIAKADYHRNQIDSYSADVYIKGTGKVNKIPGLLRSLAPKDDRKEIDDMLKRPFTAESTSKVEYSRPNTYKQEVVSKLEIGESEFDATNYIFTSFYDPLVAGELVSPLNPKAFGYYKFEHEGVFADQGELINKIKVIPRSRGEDVFEGYIYIVSDDWSLHSLDLTTYKLGFQIDIARSFAEVEEHVWMPVTTTLDAAGQIFGIGFEYHYLSTVSNYNLSLNPDLGGYVEVIDEKSQPEIARKTKKARELSELEKRLAEGDEIRTKDLRKLMRSYEKEERAKSDEPEVVSNYSYVEDSTVSIITDTAAWAEIRPVPLTAQEKLAYAISDSIEVERLAKIELNANDDDEGGIKIKTGDDDQEKRKRGPWRTSFFPEPIFTPVEGYAIGGRFGLRNRKKKIRLGLTPRYGVAWKRLSMQGDLVLGNKDSKKARIKLTGGRYLRQFDDRPAIEPWLSTYVNLFSGRNFIRLYERAYGQLEYRKKFSDAFSFEGAIAYEDRRAVTNNSNQRWFSRDENFYAPNVPFSAERGLIESVSPAATAEFNITWRPGLEYKIENGRKELLDLSAPTITAQIRTGVPEVGNSTADFFQLEAGYQRRFSAGRKGHVDFLIKGGTFLNNQSVDFPDFKHFSTSELIITSLDPIGSYRLLPYYEQSTSEEYLEVYAHYQFRKFLLTQIWKLHLMGLKEDLFVNYLHTPTSENYTELGYSIDNIFRIFRVEFVSSFRDLKYDDFGVRISVASTFGRLQ